MEEIAQMVRSKRLTIDSLAFAHSGQGLQEIAMTPMDRWMRVSNLSCPKASNKQERPYATLIVVVTQVIDDANPSCLPDRPRNPPQQREF